MRHAMIGCLLIALFLNACGSSTNDTEPTSVLPQTTTDTLTKAENITPTVSITTVSNDRLPIRRRTNGQLRARRRITVKTDAGGELLSAPLEGRYYKKGERLLAINDQDAQIALARATATRNEADFRHRELLLRMRNAAGTDTLTPIQEESMLLQSGLPTSEVAMQEATLQLERLVVYAPFAGRVADAEVQAGDRVAPGATVCSLIDLTSLEVEFNLLEREVGTIGPNSRCLISLNTEGTATIPATIDILNPQVEEGGLLRARARLGRIPRGLKLYPGMNVYVTIEDRAPLAVVVPKQAVVIRSGRQVIFVYEPATGRTAWRYVTIAQENDEAVALSEGVEAGEQVIISGNLTLDHDIPVHVK